MIKDLNYWKENCAENYMTTPISVIRYITELEDKLEETINSARCCDELKVKKTMTFDGFLIYKNILKDNGKYFVNEKEVDEFSIKFMYNELVN